MSKQTNIMNSAFNDSVSNLSHSISVNAGGLDSIINTLYKDTTSNASSYYKPLTIGLSKYEKGNEINARRTATTSRSQSLQPHRHRRRTRSSNSAVFPQEKFSSRRSSSCDSELWGSRHVSWGTFDTTVILKETLNNSSELPPLPLNNNNENTIGLKELEVRAANNDIDENDMTKQDNPQDCESQVPQKQTSTKHVVSMPWIYEQCGITGTYSGELNSLNIPHGIGTFVANLDGSSIACRWENGAIVVDSLRNANRGSKIKRRGRTSPPAKSKSTPRQQPELSPSPIPPREESEPPVMAPTSLPGYQLGTCIKHRSHMIIPQCRQEAIDNANSLQSLDFCFIKRSNGDWTYSIVADKPSNDDKAEEEREIRFVLDVKGSTKTIRRKYWGRGIRLVNTKATESILADMERAHSPQLVPKKKARQIPHQHRRKSQEPNRRRRPSQESRRSTSQPPTTTPGRLDQSRRSLVSRRSMGSDQAVVEGSPMKTIPHSAFSKPMVRRKTTGDLDLSFVSKTAVILPTNIQDGVNSSNDQSERSGDATLGTNLKNLYQPRPAKSPLRKSTNSLYTVEARPQHHEAWAVINQRGITYEQVSTKTNDGNDHYPQNPPRRPIFRTSSSCSHLPTITRKTIPFTSIQSILKNNTKSGPIRRRMSSSSMNSRVGWDTRNESDQIEESLVSMLRGDNENDQRRRGSNTSNSASLGGVALPNSSKKKSGRRRRSSLSSSASVESLSSLLREMYSPEYLAKLRKST